MRILILNGNPDPDNRGFDAYLARLSEALVQGGHQVVALPLREMDVRYCIGCFGCWVKTPGECVAADDSARVGREIVRSDFMLWASPIRMGFPSALLKKVMDKGIPLIHPYFETVHGEAHHLSRYDRYPLLGLLLEREEGTTNADVRVISEIFTRTAINMKSRLVFSLLTDRPVSEVAQAISAPAPGRVPFDPHPAPIPGERVTPPTRLTIFNGSPRGRKGNTPILLDRFAQGFTALPGRSVEVFHLNRLRESDTFGRAFGEAECVLLGFPLYTDGMPGLVKAFIETLAPYRGRTGNPPVGFLVQSGFPEPAHSRYVERYLERLARILGSPYLGTMVRGSGEGVRLMPDNMNARLFGRLYQLGRTFGESGLLDPAQLKALAGIERYPRGLVPLMKLFLRLPLATKYWDDELKKNGVYEKRFARPYLEDQP